MSKQLSFIKDWFETGVESGWIETYERELLRFLENEFGKPGDEMRLCVVFLSLFMKAGHTSLPLDRSPAQWAEFIGLDSADIPLLPNEIPDISRLKKSDMAGSPTDGKPYILLDDRLSLRRYCHYETIVGQWIEENLSNKSIGGISDISVPVLNDLFPETAVETDWQKVAAALSLFKPFLIISGGPGTGKTTTVARILALHQRLSGRRLNIALAAPTGKAAGRIGEAITRELTGMGLSADELKNFPAEARTVHRLLSGTESRGLLPPVEKKMLRYDLLIIDEASMMDLSLTYRLVSHLSEKTQLILLGDKDQLASVEAGAVFADLCQKQKNGFLPETIETLKELGLQEELPRHNESKVSDSIVYLTKSYRFDESSGIGRLSAFVKHQEHDRYIASLFEEYDDIHYQSFSYQKEDLQKLLRDLKSKIADCSKMKHHEELLSFWKQSIWLMVLRRGLTGTDRFNRLIEEQLSSERMVEMDAGWYHGRPVIITKNDYNLGVFNGDLGVALREETGGIWVYVETGSEVKRFKPERLVQYEPAYFLTVHKSQGSEFDQVHFLLPQSDTPVLTKELVYTAITRAREKFTLYGDLPLFKRGIGRETERYTGLKDMLYS